MKLLKEGRCISTLTRKFPIQEEDIATLSLARERYCRACGCRFSIEVGDEVVERKEELTNETGIVMLSLSINCGNCGMLLSLSTKEITGCILRVGKVDVAGLPAAA